MDTIYNSKKERKEGMGKTVRGKKKRNKEEIIK